MNCLRCRFYAPISDSCPLYDKELPRVICFAFCPKEMSGGRRHMIVCFASMTRMRDFADRMLDVLTGLGRCDIIASPQTIEVKFRDNGDVYIIDLAYVHVNVGYESLFGLKGTEIYIDDVLLQIELVKQKLFNIVQAARVE